MFETAKDIRVRIIFQEELLGTAAANQELYRDYIASNAPDAMTKEEQIAAIGVEKALENAMTVFPRNKDGQPILWPYQIRGMFKSAQKSMNIICGKKEAGYLPNYKGKIDQLVFVKGTDEDWAGRCAGLVIHMPEGEQMATCERPLRAETMQGPRVSLAKSETCPAGSWVEFDVRCLDPNLMDNVRDWLDYGQYNGIGQWRNSGKGRYVWKEVKM